MTISHVRTYWAALVISTVVAAGAGLAVAQVATPVTPTPSRAAGRSSRGTLPPVVVESSPAAPAAAPSIPAATAPTDPFVVDLVRRLSSTNPAEREAAQKQLAGIAQLFDQTEAMQQFAESSTDSELKSLFQARINQIKAKEEEKRLTSLPGITLSMKGAPLSQVIDALNKALNANTKFMFQNSGGETAAFDLEVKDKPFWEVFANLQDQQALEMSNNGSAITVRSVPSIGIRRYAVGGPAMAWVTNVNYSRSVNYRTPSDTSSAQPQLNFQLAIVIDPRIKATQFKTIKINKAVDDEGRTYRSNPGGGYSSGGSPSNFFNSQVLIIPPTDHLGKTLTLDLDAAVTTTVGDPAITVDDIQKNVGKQYTMGNRTVRVTNFDLNNNPNYAQFQLSVTQNSDSVPYDSNFRITYSIMDSTGRSLMSSSLSSGTTGNSVNLQNTTGPYKLELRSPGRPLDLPVHLELKDLPLP